VLRLTPGWVIHSVHPVLDAVSFAFQVVWELFFSIVETFSHAVHGSKFMGKCNNSYRVKSGDYSVHVIGFRFIHQCEGSMRQHILLWKIVTPEIVLPEHDQIDSLLALAEIRAEVLTGLEPAGVISGRGWVRQ
jgi:hypothetical protein